MSHLVERVQKLFLQSSFWHPFWKFGRRTVFSGVKWVSESCQSNQFKMRLVLSQIRFVYKFLSYKMVNARYQILIFCTNSSSEYWFSTSPEVHSGEIPSSDYSSKSLRPFFFFFDTSFISCPLLIFSQFCELRVQNFTQSTFVTKESKAQIVYLETINLVFGNHYF